MTSQLVWLLSRCSSAWYCCVNLGRNAQSVRTEQAAAGREEMTTLGLTLLLGPCSSEVLVLTAVWRSCCSAWCQCARRAAVQVQTCPTGDFVIDLVLLFLGKARALTLVQHLWWELTFSCTHKSGQQNRPAAFPPEAELFQSVVFREVSGTFYYLLKNK